MSHPPCRILEFGTTVSARVLGLEGAFVGILKNVQNVMNLIYDIVSLATKEYLRACANTLNRRASIVAYIFVFNLLGVLFQTYH